MKLLYNAGIYLISAGINIVSLFNKKVELWVRGRKGIFARMAKQIDPDSPLAWFHAASLGEFEQGRPVIEAFRTQYPEYKILVTFYSPSGYEVRKNYAGADYIFYLPSDTSRNVRRFMRIVHPEIAVFIKYEFWVNYLTALHKAGKRIFSISAIFRPDQSFFKWYGGIFRKILHYFTHIFVQDEQSLQLLENIGITPVSITGDTRFDRVAAIALAAKPIPVVERFTTGHKVFIAGSTWPADEDMLVSLINKATDTRFIIAPHEIDPVRIDKLIERIQRTCLRYTAVTPDTDIDPSGAEVLIIDTIGILSAVYRYGHYAYIGGGFGAGIHNTLEAAVFGLPLSFGPNFQKFREARELIAQGGATSISDANELLVWFEGLRNDPEKYHHASAICSGYVLSHRGATEQIMLEICR